MRIISQRLINLGFDLKYILQNQQVVKKIKQSVGTGGVKSKSVDLLLYEIV